MGEGVLTRAFPRVGGAIHCGSHAAEALAATYGTPLYVYDIALVRERVRAFQQAFSGLDHLIAYSVKANGNLSVLRALAEMGCGADVTSGGELFRARRAGVPADRIVFAGVGKTVAEVELALAEGIQAFNVESRAELERIAEVAAAHGATARFGVRVNPDVLVSTPHHYTATGHAATKFGVPWGEVRGLYAWAGEQPSLDPVGIDVHIGSQIVDPDPYDRAVDRVLELAAELSAGGAGLEYFDIGGGFGISYDGRPALDVAELAARVVPRIRDAGLRLVLEPGRALVGDAGVLLVKVQYLKKSEGKTFVIVDGGMSELIRPSHYGGYHEIEPASDPSGVPVRPVDVVGPICETGDFLALDRPLPEVAQGDVLVVRTSGAYGFSMASNYNGRPRPAEVLVDGPDIHLARRRETYEDLIRGEE